MNDKELRLVTNRILSLKSGNYFVQCDPEAFFFQETEGWRRKEFLTSMSKQLSLSAFLSRSPHLSLERSKYFPPRILSGKSLKVTRPYDGEDDSNCIPGVTHFVVLTKRKWPIVD